MQRRASGWVAGLCAAVLALGSVPVAGQAPAEPAFTTFLADLRTEALASGITAATFDRAFAGVTPDRALPDLEIAGRPKPARGGQAEFSQTPLQYLDLPRLTRLAADGRDLAARHAATLDAIEQRLGVERRIVLAIWGRETAYGQYKPVHPVIRVLATQAYLGRRKDMFRAELLAALRMIQDGIIDPRTTRASWAGALGLTQFMPSEFYGLAIDQDGDGRRDIFGSVPDALASAANQLKAKGWIAGQPWGFEVVLPAGLSCVEEGQAQARKVSAWIAEGVRRADGRSIAVERHTDDAFILTPGGAYGPAFLVFENFLVLKRYNFADLYAVFVGHLGDRIAGGGAFVTPWTTPPLITNRDIEEVQTLLQVQGYAVDKIDGRAGMNTRRTIGLQQRAAGRTVDCWPSATLLGQLRAQKR